MGLISAMVVPQGAQWDYGKLAVGLKDNGGNLASTRINTTAVAQAFEAKIAAEAETFSADGTLFALEVHFKPNQEVFGLTEYGKDFEAALKLSQNYAGAVLLIEGHGDTKRLNDLRAQGKSETEIALVEQALRNVSMKRAEAVKAAYIAFCQSKGINTASSAIVAVGMGVKTPKVAVPKSDLDMAANRRVEFKIKNIEAEAGLFNE
jgi:outer membrane protein OmpA-like peptidoglycan-associated protein